MFGLEKQVKLLYNASMATPIMTQTAAPAPKLTRRTEFEEALKDYKISEEGQKILRETPLTVLIAPTSTGRNTLIKELLGTGSYYFIISDTTRPPRQNDGVWEHNGVEYFFRKEDEMLEDIKAGMFLEAEVIHNQQVSGISIREIKKARDQGKVAITDVEILGGVTVADNKPDATVIYLVPPSFEEWLRRIHGRSPIGKEELRNRMEGAIRSFRLALKHTDKFIFIVNVEKEYTVKVIEKIEQTGDRNKTAEKDAQELTRTLWKQTEEYLKTL
jgi:guanylate kinase